MKIPDYVYRLARENGNMLAEQVRQSIETAVINARHYAELHRMTVMEVLREKQDGFLDQVPESEVIAILAEERAELDRINAMDADEFIEYLESHTGRDAPITER
jgi:hypothetical protein